MGVALNEWAFPRVGPFRSEHGSSNGQGAEVMKNAQGRWRSRRNIQSGILARGEAPTEFSLELNVRGHQAGQGAVYAHNHRKWKAVPHGGLAVAKATALEREAWHPQKQYKVYMVLHVLEFWPEARLASISTDVDVVSASTIWTPTLTPASSDVDANFSDLHALQSPELQGQASPAIGEKSPTAIMPSHHLSGASIRRSKASFGILLQLEARGNQGEGFPTTGLAPASTKNPEEWCFEGFLGLPKESFNSNIDPFGGGQVLLVRVETCSPSLRSPRVVAVLPRCPTVMTLAIPTWVGITPWLREVDVAERRPVRTSRDVTSGQSSRPRHRKDLYFPHRRLWIMEYSCKVWCKPSRRRLIPRQHSRLSWRLRKCIPSLLVCIEDRILDGCFFLLKMKDYDAILGLDWIEEHYALVDYRRKRIVFRIPSEDEFSHPLPRNLAGKMVISAMKAMRMVNKGCDAFLASVFWSEARLASISTDVDVVSASTIWTPTLTPASSDVDTNFFDLHAL
ncbi:hypothetical protein Taro_005355 [Colocasia esculenta]|uniref:Uncharacterized protein n=1 Tax=Colocasia esculenta TaxID=4460 RepID=A0A843TKQ5_COLES|nr:hypothetical protein [Colocasia esculenta]